MDIPDELHEIFNFILDEWRRTEFQLSQTDLTQIQHALTSGDALSDAVVRRINHYIGTHLPAETPPAWLDDIDAYFQQPADRPMPASGKKNMQYANAYAHWFISGAHPVLL